MEPFEKVQSRNRAIHGMNRIKEETCKNAHFLIQAKDHVPEMRIFPYDIQNMGCKNKRRNGSAYCQECSDAHTK